MNEQLQGKLVEILSGIQSATKAAGDFALDQLPDIAQQYVTYGRVWLPTTVLISLGILVLAVWRYAVNHANFEQDDCYEYVKSRTGRQMLAMFGYVAMGVLAAANFLLSIEGAFLVWFAPKVWLLKELASLVK